MFGKQPFPGDEAHHWQRFRQDNEESFTYFHDAYYNQLYFYGLKIVGDEEQVKNAIQELFLHLWRNRRQLSPVYSVKHYLLCAFRRHLHRLLDKERQQRKLAQVSPTDHFVFSAEDLLVERETEALTRARLAQALNGLPPRQREVLYLRYTTGFTPTEIAELLGINYQSVLNIVNRATRTLRHQMTCCEALNVLLALLPLALL